MLTLNLPVYPSLYRLRLPLRLWFCLSALPGNYHSLFAPPLSYRASLSRYRFPWTNRLLLKLAWTTAL